MIRSLMALVFLGSSMIAGAQTADEIVNKYINAIGGKEVIKNIKSIITEADLSIMGSSLSSTTTVLVGKGFRNEANFNGQMIIQVVTPTGGWMLNPLAGQTEPQALPEDQVKAAQTALNVGGALTNYKEQGGSVKLDGTQDIEGVKAHKIVLTDKEKKQTTYFIDPSTYYLLKTESVLDMGGTSVTGTSTFSNYKKTDQGLVIPYTTVNNQGFEITINVTKVTFNKDIDPKIFEMPK